MYLDISYLQSCDRSVIYLLLVQHCTTRFHVFKILFQFSYCCVRILRIFWSFSSIRCRGGGLGSILCIWNVVTLVGDFFVTCLVSTELILYGYMWNIVWTNYSWCAGDVILQLLSCVFFVQSGESPCVAAGCSSPTNGWKSSSRDGIYRWYYILITYYFTYYFTTIIGIIWHHES